MTQPPGTTTTSLTTLPRGAGGSSQPGLVLIHSQTHRSLPSALAFDGPTTTVGRDGDNDLAIGESAVSRRHARFVLSPRPSVEDLGSTNGVFVNGQRVKRRELVEHDIVRIGDSLFRYTSSDIFSYMAYRPDGSALSQARPFDHPRSETLIGGFQIDRIVSTIERIAPTLLSVIVRGESGTGKELVAAELHRRSRRAGPFQAINCAALPANLIEAELFGVAKGAFTGATQNRAGLIRSARGGTLFLDEIGDMPLEAQAKLLRVLQQREVIPVGADRPEPIDVRVVCATHRALEERVASGSFRGDLLARLREVELTIPPLRQRLEDLGPLVRHFLGDQQKASGAYLLCLGQYGFPYNVRELESAVRLSKALSSGDELTASTLPPVMQEAQRRVSHAAPQAPPRAAAPARMPSEGELRALLAKYGGNVAEVGRRLGKKRMQIHRWAKRYGIRLDDFRAP